MKTFLEFVQQRKNQQIVAESFNDKNIDEACNLISDILKKHITRKMLVMPGFVQNKIGSDMFYSKQYVVVGKDPGKNDTVFELNWSQKDGKWNIYSIDFFNNEDILWQGKAKAALSLYTLGSSIVYFLPIIWSVVNSGNFNISKEKAIALGRSMFKNTKVKESKYCVGDIDYTIVENVSDSVIRETFNLRTINEAGDWGQDQDVTDYLAQLRAIRNEKELHRHDGPEEKEAARKASKEYWDTVNKVKAGAKTMADLKLAVKKDVQVYTQESDTEKKHESEIKKEHIDPETQFKMMEKYVNMVIKGINPSVILCGAPGVGKTYRVKKVLRGNGYHEGAASADKKMMTIKGKMSTRQLYMALYEMQDKGNVLVIDDADSVVGPKAPEDSINILKAALDSTSDDEGRLVTYAITGKLQDEEGNDIPKRFYYRGSVIIITNYSVGQLNTALRGRSYVQDLDFNVDDVLQIIKKLLPDMVKENHLHAESGTQAYDYLTELKNNNSKMEVSLRTFVMCAKMYEANRDETNDKIVRLMIKQNMENMALRGGKSY